MGLCPAGPILELMERVALCEAEIARALDVDPAALNQGAVSTYVDKAHEQTITGFFQWVEVPPTALTVQAGRLGKSRATR